MKTKFQLKGRHLGCMAVLVLLAGLLVSGWFLERSGIRTYPGRLADAFEEKQVHLTVPGSTFVHLTRTGAYGIYLETNLDESMRKPNESLPPAIDCSLTATATQAKIEAVPDYIETNRYTSDEGDRLGVLVMSITVAEPGEYTFACNYQEGDLKPGIIVALGPNYAWEFLRVAWKIALPLLTGTGIACGSGLLALVLLIAAVILRSAPQTHHK